MTAARRLAGLGILAAILVATTSPAAEDTGYDPTSYTLFRKPPQPVKAVVDGFLWIEAEDFTDYGGWRLDTQFVQQMGSAYLIAAGVGRPIDNATLTLDVPQAGTYRLWVRAKNWLAEQAPGKFRVAVGDVTSAKVFGAAPSTKWLWESGGDFKLPAGPVRLALVDQTGYFARCDTLLLTSDRNYTPPDDITQLDAERSRLGGVSHKVRDEGQFDVIVVGGGAAGCCAAISAARLGATTALIQDRPVLGGNASDELGVGICGASAGHANARESGVMEEAGREKGWHNFQRMSEGFRLVAEREKNLRIFFNRRAVAASMHNPAQIARVHAVDTLTGQRSMFQGKLFIDSTGDGWIGYYAKAQYRLGRESREEFGEDLAPPAADKITMSGCLMGNYTLSYRAKSTKHPVDYVPPPWAAKLPEAKEFGRRITHIDWGDWWLEHSGEIDDLWEPEYARDELIRISFGYWDFIKNRWEWRAQARNFALSFVPYMNARRETRRLIGDYIFRQQDAQNAVMFPDRISYGGWPLDVHHPQGIFSGKAGPFDCDAHVPIYSIPFRILYSVNIDNLLFAGRNLSTSHIGLGTLRVQGTLSTLGQAAGTAAALCLEKQCTPRELGLKHITLLQQTLLKHDQYIPELKNEDAADLARTAKVTATSTAKYATFGRADVEHHESHPLNMPRAVMLPRGANAELKNVYLLLFNQQEQPVEVTLTVRGAAAADDFASTKDLATAQAKVAPGRLAWVKFAVNCSVEQPYVWFALPKTPGVAWRLMNGAPPGSCRAYGGGGSRPWTIHTGQYYAVYLDPPTSLPVDYRPENVINGISRTVGTTPNLWASDPQQPLPQSIELEFPQPVKLNTVYLTFDTDMNDRYHKTSRPRECVRDYRLAYHDGRQWRDLAVEKDNYQRRRTHRFDTVMATRLRVTVEATGGVPTARIFEIRAYHEQPAGEKTTQADRRSQTTPAPTDEPPEAPWRSAPFRLCSTAAAAPPMTLETLREQRKTLAQRPRRLIFNNDGCDALYFPPKEEITAENLLAARTTALAGTHVGAIAYCTISSGFSFFTHNTQAGDVLNRNPGDYGLQPGRRNVTQPLIDAGADCLKIMVDFAHRQKLECFWSMRMNDTHDAEHKPEKPFLLFPPLKVQHPEWLVGNHVQRTKHGRWSSVDYARPEIRDRAFRYLEEVCRNYDVDGVELDFFRHLCYFKSVAQGGKASPEEVGLMTDLLRRVRTMTEEVGLKRQRPILVLIRVPDSVEFCRDMGFDLKGWLQEGLADVLITTCYFQLNPWEYSVRLGHDYGVPVYPCLSDSRVRLEDRFHRSSIECYRGRAMNAWAAGADGLHIFNLFNPLSPVFRELGDPQGLVHADKLYFVTVRDGKPDAWLAGGTAYRTLPLLTPTATKNITPQQPLATEITVGDEPSVLAGSSPAARVTLHVNVPGLHSAGGLAATINGHPLPAGKLVGQWVDFPVAAQHLVKGQNRVELSTAALQTADDWNLVYDAQQLPTAPWRCDNGSARTEAKVDGGALLIADRGTQPGDYLYYRVPWGADPTGSTAVEARVKVISGTNRIIITNGVGQERLDIQPDRVQLWSKPQIQYAMQTTDDFHVYRLETAGKDICVFVDGQLRLEGKGLLGTRPAQERNEVAFGASDSTNEGAAWWSYVRTRRAALVCQDIALSITWEK